MGGEARRPTRTLRNCIAAAKMPPVGLASLPRTDSATMGPMMKMRALAAAGLAVFLSGSLTMGAGVSVKSVMRSWKAKANATAQMLNGGAHYDEAAIRESLRAFTADAQAIDARLTGATAANRDMKMRFEKFQRRCDGGARSGRRQRTAQAAFRQDDRGLSVVPRSIRQLTAAGGARRPEGFSTLPVEF